jgi:hypothetical protein
MGGGVAIRAKRALVQRFGKQRMMGQALSVVVAWYGKHEGGRTVRDALPLLARASHVEWVSFADSGVGPSMSAV